MEETFIKRVRKLLCFIIFVALVFSLCSCNNYKLSYKKPQNYSVYRFALKVGESKEFDFDEIFANCSVKADRIEINNSSKIYSVKGNTITAKNTGVIDVSAKLYNNETMTVYEVSPGMLYAYDEKDFFKIRTVEDLQSVKGKNNYLLMNDLDLSSVENWKPIERYSGMFINPNGYVIKNLNIENETSCEPENRGGLFDMISGGFLYNIKLENVNVNAYTSVGWTASAGAIVGSFYNGYLLDCSAKGNVTAASYVGGIAGAFSFATIENCTFEGNVVNISRDEKIDHTSNVAGGIVGYTMADSKDAVQARIVNCSVNANLTAEGSVGGISAYVWGKKCIQNCSFPGQFSETALYKGEYYGFAFEDFQK